MLPETLARAIEQALSAGGDPVTIARSSPVGGGCINEAALLQLSNGQSAFAKWRADTSEREVAMEANGLRALGKSSHIRVPRVLAQCTDGRHACLVLEAIRSAPQRPDFQESLGRQLARHHHTQTHPRCGFDEDNLIGATPQPNAWSDDWPAFWREHRLLHQLRLAQENNLATRELVDATHRLADKLDRLLGQPEEPFCLLHGDLWGGNVMADENGAPVLIDPAVYYGRREADLAMTRLFGGFDRRFYEAYDAEWPLAPAWQHRSLVYELYHLMNHLNLFGTSYRAGCIERLDRLGFV